MSIKTGTGAVTVPAVVSNPHELSVAEFMETVESDPLGGLETLQATGRKQLLNRIRRPSYQDEPTHGSADFGVGVRVIRGGTQKTVDKSDLVVGDVLSLQSGDVVPADCRVIETKEEPMSPGNGDAGIRLSFGSTSPSTPTSPGRRNRCHVHDIFSHNRTMNPLTTDAIKSNGVSVWDATNVVAEGSVVTSGSFSACVFAVGTETMVEQLRGKKNARTYSKRNRKVKAWVKGELHKMSLVCSKISSLNGLGDVTTLITTADPFLTNAQVTHVSIGDSAAFNTKDQAPQSFQSGLGLELIRACMFATDAEFDDWAENLASKVDSAERRSKLTQRPVQGERDESAILRWCDSMQPGCDRVRKECPRLLDMPPSPDKMFRVTVHEIGGRDKVMVMIGPPKILLEKCRYVARDSPNQGKADSRLRAASRKQSTRSRSSTMMSFSKGPGAWCGGGTISEVDVNGDYPSFLLSSQSMMVDDMSFTRESISGKIKSNIVNNVNELSRMGKIPLGVMVAPVKSVPKVLDSLTRHTIVASAAFCWLGMVGLGYEIRRGCENVGLIAEEAGVRLILACPEEPAFVQSLAERIGLMPKVQVGPSTPAGSGSGLGQHAREVIDGQMMMNNHKLELDESLFRYARVPRVVGIGNGMTPRMDDLHEKLLETLDNHGEVVAIAHECLVAAKAFATSHVSILLRYLRAEGMDRSSTAFTRESVGSVRFKPIDVASQRDLDKMSEFADIRIDDASILSLLKAIILLRGGKRPCLMC